MLRVDFAMGKTTFFRFAKGDNAEQAFDTAVRGARHDRGYREPIVQKKSFVKISVKPLEQQEALDVAYKMTQAMDLMAAADGPAGALQVVQNEWLFFGWADDI